MTAKPFEFCFPFQSLVAPNLSMDGWRLAKLSSVTTNTDWTLWASHGASGSAEAQAAQLERLQRIHLSAEGSLQSTYIAPPLVRWLLDSVARLKVIGAHWQ